MKPYYSDSHVTIYHGDALTVLREMPDASVHCVVTSPPYWGLRDYGTAEWEGGDPECDHAMPPSGIRGVGRDRAASGGTFHDSPKPENVYVAYRDTCGKCGATRKDRQLGIEPTPEGYVARLVEVFREVRRVLRDDGTLWLNLGDCYTSGGRTWREADAKNDARAMDKRADTPSGLKPKDLVGIPWRVAFALQADGWYLRSDIIWAKPNPMPESVTDRPTKAHEYVFLLTKSERYFYDADAIREANVDDEETFYKKLIKSPHERQRDAGGKNETTGGFQHATFNPAGRNRRTVWTITTKPYPEAHFATFPPELPRLCIMAGCPEGGTVLDPFGGSGTTAHVAKEIGRDAVLIELSADYCRLAARRCSQEVIDLGTP